MKIFANAVHQIKYGFYGWRILALMLGPRAGGSGAVQYGNSIFLLPLEQAFGLNRTMASLIFSFAMLVGNLTAPISGILIDRFGARKILLGSILLTAAGYLIYAAATNLALAIIAIVGFVGVGFITLSYQATSVITNNWFDRYKASAMSLLQVGAGLGGFVIAPILVYANATWNWRIAAVAAAVAIVVVSLPAVIFSRNTPEEMGMEPDGARRTLSRNTPGFDVIVTTGLTIKEAMKTKVFWFLVIAMALFSSTMFTVNLHFVAILVWKGVPEVRAGIVLSVWAFVSIPVVLIAGVFADRFPRAKVAGILVFMTVAGAVILNLASASWVYWLAIIPLSGIQGFYPLVWAATGEAYGRRDFGTIRGVITAFMAPIGFCMPILAGRIFDWTGTYTITLWIVAVCALAAGVLLVMTPRIVYESKSTE
jgi:MFS family permease